VSYDAVASTDGSAVYVVVQQESGTAYEITSIAADGTVATPVSKSRACDGPIAIAAAPNGTHVQVIRGNSTGDSTNVEGDYLSVAGPFADVTVNQAVGTATASPDQITAAYRSTQDSGQYRCYAFWSAGETTGASDFVCKSNWVDTGGTLGS